MMTSKGTEHFRKEGGVSCSREVKEGKNEKRPLFLAIGRLVVPSMSSEANLYRDEESVGNEGKIPERK